MGVEVQDVHGSVLRVDRAQYRICHRVIAAEHYRAMPFAQRSAD
jgi:hypothetical protein